MWHKWDTLSISLKAIHATQRRVSPSGREQATAYEKSAKYDSAQAFEKNVAVARSVVQAIVVHVFLL